MFLHSIQPCWTLSEFPLIESSYPVSSSRQDDDPWSTYQSAGHNSTRYCTSHTSCRASSPRVGGLYTYEISKKIRSNSLHCIVSYTRPVVMISWVRLKTSSIRPSTYLDWRIVNKYATMTKISVTQNIFFSFSSSYIVIVLCRSNICVSRILDIHFISCWSIDSREIWRDLSPSPYGPVGT